MTDEKGHAVGHGCARPEPKSHRKRAGPGPPPGGFSFTPASRDGPPHGHRTWRLCTPGPGPDLIITVEPLTTDPCDHRLKQHPKWTVDQLPDGTFRWNTPAGRTYDTEPTRYPI